MSKTVKKFNINKFCFVLIVAVCTQLFFALLNPYNYYEISSQSIIIYITYYFFSVLSLLLFSPRKWTEYHFSYRQQKISTYWQVLVYSLPAYIIFISAIAFVLVKNLSIQLLRDTFFYGDGSVLPFVFGEIFIYLSVYIGLGYYLLISYIVRYKIQNAHSDKISFLIVASGIFILDSATGGRMALFYISIITYIVNIVIPNEKAKILSGRIAKTLVGILIIIFSSIMISRLANDEKNIFEFLNQYLIGPVFLMDQGLIDTFGLTNETDVRIGMSLMSVDWIIIGMAKIIGHDLRTLFDISNNILSVGYYLNNNYGINAFFTAPFYFYLDYGLYLGIAIFILYFILLKLSKFNNNEQRHATILVFVCFTLVLGLRENIFNSPAFLYSIVLLFIFPFSSIKSNNKNILKKISYEN